MGVPDHTPVIVGVGDVCNRSRKADDAIEPIELMLTSINKAIDDVCPESSRADLKGNIDALYAVNSWAWPCPDLPSALAQRLNIQPKLKITSKNTGEQSCKLLDDAARLISEGKSQIALLTGGEALASLMACIAAKKMPPPGWSARDTAEGSGGPPQESLFNPGDWQTPREGGDGPDLAGRHKIGAPIQVYPMFENALRAHRGQTIKQNNEESSQLYAEFAKMAEENEYAWNYGKPAMTATEIGTVSKANRMICFPYRMVMNAFNNVNLSCALIMTSAKVAGSLQIPKDKWIYVLGGAGTMDSNDFWFRPNFHSSPAVAQSIDAALEVSGLTKEQIDLHDIYSCFPIVPKFAAEHLGLDCAKPAKPLSVLGGLSFFGGAGNNYSMHATTEMVRQLRSGKGKKNGLVLANGGVVTKEHVVCFSRVPRADGLAYGPKPSLPKVITGLPVPECEDRPEGEAIIETYTVEFGRDGKAFRGHVVGRLPNGKRFVANAADEATIRGLSSFETEPIGRSGFVKAAEDGRNVFSLSDTARL